MNNNKKEINKRGEEIARDIEIVDSIVNVVSTIVNRREELGISLDELGRRADVSKLLLEEIEDYAAFPSLIEFINILQVLRLKMKFIPIKRKPKNPRTYTLEEVLEKLKIEEKD